ncbi:hypothetical protein GDO81_023133 [Engystomops pustulosus]|uniref:Shadow of prion protein n=1 Tax=Engystomops pustulosus TaxID=76066 RepID=A0AAV6Z6T7_ENGPU|nr:hypothetical protein GDO81_023133 [Engystomops pustulosus]
MRGSSALCWSVLLLVALLTHTVNTKGGRGGARGGARGAARGASRVRVRTPTRYGSFRVAAGAAAAGAVAGAAAGIAGRRRWRYDDSSEVSSQWGNQTDDGIYSYRAWTSGTNILHTSLPVTLTYCAAAILKYFC